MYFVVLAIFLVGFFFILRVIHSPFGQVLKAVRENEPRAVSLGYKAEQLQAHRLRALGRARRAGRGTKAIVFQLASLTDVHWSTSGEVILMMLLGGLGTVFGPMVGAVIVDRAGELPRPARRVGDRGPGRDLRGLRARLPPRASSASWSRVLHRPL